MKPTDPPRPTGNPDVNVNVTGMLFAWSDTTQQPVFVSMPGSPLLFLALFTDPDKLRALYAHVHTPFDRIKQIEDHAEFLSSFEGHDELVIIAAPYVTPAGRIRYRELKPEKIS